jgi:catechol-2,3-dioxygenase
MKKQPVNLHPKNPYQQQMNDYLIPSETQIGHVHLKVSNLERSLQFYRDLLGF